MREKPHHFDSRTGGIVDCLPATHKPHAAKSPDDCHVVTAASHEAMLAAIQDRLEWLDSGQRSQDV